MTGLVATLALAVGLLLDRLLGRLLEPRGEIGFADELVWGVPVGEFEDGVVLNRDGSLMVGFRLEGPDRSSSSSEEMATLSRVVHGALEKLSERYLVSLDAVRRPAEGYAGEGDFPDAVSRAIDAERRERFGRREYWVTETVLVLIYEPPPEVYERAARFFVNEESGEADREWSSSVEVFFRDLQGLEGELCRVLRLERLDVEALAGHLRSCVVGQSSEVKVPRGEVEVDLSYLVGSEDFVGGFAPRIGDRHLRVVAVHGYPSLAREDAMEPFHSVPFACRSSHRLQLLSRSRGERLISGARERWWHKSQAGGAAPGTGHEVAQKVFGSTSAENQAIDASEALDGSVEGATRFAVYNWNLVVTDTDRGEADRKAAYLAELFSSRGFTASVERANAPAAYLGSLPGHGGYNVRRPLLSVRSLSALLPLSSPWLGHEHCPSELLPRRAHRFSGP